MTTVSTDWITQLLFNDDGSLSTPHIHLCGATGSGKSTLGEYVLSLLREGLEVETHLINPKHIESRPDWSFPPFIKSIDGCVDGLQQCQKLISDRLSDPNFDPTTTGKILIVVDEWDWIYAQFGKAAVNALRPLFKVGRGVGVHLLLVGQSPLATDTGLSGSDYRNMARIVLNGEAIAFLDNRQFPYDKSDYYPTAKQYHASGKRFALVVPMVGLPFVALVPHLSKPQSAFNRVQSTTMPDRQDAVELRVSDDLGEPLKTIWLFTKERDYWVTVREIQRRNFSVLKGKKSQDIHRYLGLLADSGYGEIDENDKSTSSVAFKSY